MPESHATISIGTYGGLSIEVESTHTGIGRLVNCRERSLSLATMKKL